MFSVSRFLIALTTVVTLLFGAPLASADTTSWVIGPAPLMGGSRIATDTAGNVYACDPSSGMVKKYTGTGTFLGTVGPRATGLLGVTSSPDGGVYVASTNPPEPGYTITKYDSGGTAVQTIAVGSGSGPGQVAQISGFGADGAGNLYILDTSSSRIEKFLANGSYSTQWGSPGDGNGQFDFSQPQGALGVGTDGTVYVSDHTNRIQKFTSTGDFLTAWGSTGSGIGQFVTIGSLTVDSTGHVYAADLSPRWTGNGIANGSVIQEFDSSGNYLGSASQPVVALATYGNDLVYGMSGSSAYRFELTTPDVSISLSPAGAPSSVYVRQPLTATATASVPFGSITGFSFDFGAGGPVVAGSSATATASYTTAGTYRVTVKATSSRGGSASASALVVVNPAATGVVKALPKLSGLLVSPARFRAAHTGNSVTKSTSLGTSVRYTLSLAGAVRFTIQRVSDGRQVGPRCVAPARSNRGARHCTRFVAVRGTLTMTGRVGKNNFRFSGRLNGSPLAPGNYRLVATPTAGGSTGIAQTTGFTILR